MRSSDPSIAWHLGTAHLALALLTLLAVGWLQSDFAPRPWWQGETEWLGTLADKLVAWRFATMGYLLLAVLAEWRIGVVLRNAVSWPRSSGLFVLAWHFVVLISVGAAIARGPSSRTLLADLDEWLIVAGVVALLSVALLVAGLLFARESWRLPGDSAEEQQSTTRGLTLVAWALGVAALFFVIATVALETQPLPHVALSPP